MGRVLRRSAGMVVVLVLLLPAAAAAQAAITGVVKDTSGAVLPGTTVEAASPVLIEKVRSVVTDATGQYRIVNLRPGTYSVTFTLTGFSAVKRDGIELTGNFVATVNADLKVGSVAETVTVSGQAPTVDVQSTRTQQTLSKDILAAVPTARTNSDIAVLVPGLLSIRPDVGGVGSNPTSQGDTGPIHGGRFIDPRSMTDGMTTNHGNGGSGTGNLVNVAGAQEVVITTSGGLGDAETSGVTVNVIPRDGANTFSGTFVVNGANGSMQGSNYTEDLKNRGLTAPSQLLKVYDINPMGGGRIVRDRLWFYVTERVWGTDVTVPGMFANKNAGNPNAWTYDPDFSRQTFNDGVNKTHIGRLTWQATPRNKLTGYWSQQYSCERCRGGAGVGGGSTATATTESNGIFEFDPSHIFQVTYSSPVSSRFVVEAGYGAYLATWGSGWRSPTGTLAGEIDNSHNTELVRVVEQGGIIPNLAYRFPANFNRNQIATRTWRASVSYVPGAHNMKFGYYGGRFPAGEPNITFYLQDAFQYRFNNGVPNQLSEQGIGTNQNGQQLVSQANTWGTSLYAQDQWTRGRLTLQGGARYDHTWTTYPPLSVGGTRIIPQVITFPAGSTQSVHWSDISPRMGVAYDLFGTGKTAVKVNLGKYMEALSALNDGALNPLPRIATTTTRSWNDRGGLGIDGDYVPQCNLANPDANGECGPMANRNLGTNTITRTWDDNYIHGWGKRPYNWELAATVQQQLFPRVSLSVGYFRRWFGNWYTTQNRALSPSDYTPFYLTAPLDSRLPGGGGYQVGPIYDVVPTKVGLVDQYSTWASNFAEQTEHWNGFDINIAAREGRFTAQGGTSTGRKYADNCALRAVLPELGSDVAGLSAAPVPTVINGASPTSPFCHYQEPFLARGSGLAAYTIPKVEVQVSGTFQSNPGLPPVGVTGTDLAALWVVPNAVARQALGRDLSGGAANITVNMVQPGTVFADRVNQFDFRVAKILKFQRMRTQIMLDVYNLTNTNTPLTYNQTYNPTGQWLTPTSVLTARFFKIGAQIDF
jgi:hypothetical protein